VKNEKMTEILDLADDKYIEESAPKHLDRKQKRKTKRIVSILVAAVVLISLTALCLWLFLPFSWFEDVAGEYEDYEYYKLIKEMEQDKQYSEYVSNMFHPVYKNNFEKYILSKIRGEEWFENPTERVAISGDGNNTTAEQTYIEVTDNEVEAVIESDYLKLTDKYAYYGAGRLSVIKYDGENSEVVGSSSDGVGEILLTNDCNSVIQVGRGALWLLDVSDAKNIETKNKVVFSGSIQGARLYGNTLIITAYQSKKEDKDIDYENKDTYVPYIEINGEKQYVPSEDIKVMGYNGWRTRMNYVSVWLFDATTLEYKDSKTIFAPVHRSTITDYVTRDKIFLAYSYYEENLNDSKTVLTNGYYSDIVCYSYDEEHIEYKGDTTLNCNIDGRYQMSEKNGILRIAADYYEKVSKRTTDETYFDYFGEIKRNAVVLCIDTDSWKTVGKIEGFMPKGESVQSVRFEGDLCYVCTAKVVKAQTTTKVTDPVFCFDLSDPKNITYKDTGEIVGYSSSLVRIGDYLLGIGVGETGEDFKLELFKETENAVVSVDTYLEKMEYITPSYPGYSQNYKDYYIDKDNFLIGFLLNSKYTLVSCRDGRFEEIFKKEIVYYSDGVRGYYSDGWFYIFASNDEKIIPVKVDIG